MRQPTVSGPKSNKALESLPILCHSKRVEPQVALLKIRTQNQPKDLESCTPGQREWPSSPQRRFSTGRYLSAKAARELWSSIMLSSMSTGLEHAPTDSGLTIHAANTLCGTFSAMAWSKSRSTGSWTTPSLSWEPWQKVSSPLNTVDGPAHPLELAQRPEVGLHLCLGWQGKFVADAVPEPLRDSRPVAELSPHIRHSRNGRPSRAPSANGGGPGNTNNR